MLGLDPHVGFDSGCLEEKNATRVRIAESTPQREFRGLGSQRFQNARGEVLEVDRREPFGLHIIELDFRAGRHTHQADLSCRVVHGEQTDGLFEGERAGGDLGFDPQRKGLGLRRGQADAQPACVRVKAPERERRGEDVGDGRTAGDLETHFRQFALGGPNLNFVETLDHAGTGDVELVEFRIEDLLLVPRVATARFPRDPRIVHRSEDQRC